jgi:hypothetical protein
MYSTRYRTQVQDLIYLKKNSLCVLNNRVLHDCMYMYVMCVYIYYNIFLFVVCDSLSTAYPRVLRFFGEKNKKIIRQNCCCSFIELSQVCPLNFYCLEIFWAIHFRIVCTTTSTKTKF